MYDDPVHDVEATGAAAAAVDERDEASVDGGASMGKPVDVPIVLMPTGSVTPPRVLNSCILGEVFSRKRRTIAVNY